MFVGDLVNLPFICKRRKEIVEFSVIFADKRQKLFFVKISFGCKVFRNVKFTKSNPEGLKVFDMKNFKHN